MKKKQNALLVMNESHHSIPSFKYNETLLHDLKTDSIWASFVFWTGVIFFGLLGLVCLPDWTNILRTISLRTIWTNEGKKVISSIDLVRDY